MRNGWRNLIFAVLLAGNCMAAEPVKAQARKPVPAIVVSDSAGTSVNLAKTGNSGHWLLLYVHAGNPSSENMLQQLKASKYGAYSSRMVVLVGGLKSDELLEWSKQFPDLATVRWLADPQRTAMRALNLHGVPVEVGLNDNGMEWQLSGVLHDSEMFDATLLSWLKHEN